MAVDSGSRLKFDYSIGNSRTSPHVPEMARLGICHLCGTYTELTFEHVPPRNSFNDRPLVTKVIEDVLRAESLEELKGARVRRQPRGAGAYTLCAPCNNKTGAWYGKAYADWVHKALTISEYAKTAPSLYQTFQIFPLRVIKQIACMFFSANRSSFQIKQEETVRFVLNKERKYLEPRFRIYTYFNRSPMSRQAAVTGQLRLGQSLRVYSEISFPPLGYILSLSGPAPHTKLCDISFFSKYDYNTWTDISLNIPVLTVASPMPGDFRSEGELYSPEFVDL